MTTQPQKDLSTKRPWRIQGREIVSDEHFHAYGHLRNKEGFSNASYSYRICEMNGSMVKPMDELDPLVPMANARLIIKAVNNFDELVKALKNCNTILDVYINGSNPNSPYKDGMHSCYVFGAKEVLEKAKQALKKAGDL